LGENYFSTLTQFTTKMTSFWHSIKMVCPQCSDTEH